MNESITLSEQVHRQFSARATLAGLGVKLHKLKALEPVEQQVKIAQKTVKYTPLEKLTDGLIAILTGAHGLVEINKRVRADPLCKQRLGARAVRSNRWCKKRWMPVQPRTWPKCSKRWIRFIAATARAMAMIMGSTCSFWTSIRWRPCGRKAAFATKGYFARRPNRRGRQEGYVLATWYEEIVVKQLFPGTTQLTAALQPLLEAGEQTFDLTPEKRQRTILRIDSGGGSVDDVNWMLGRGYQLHCKDYSGRRAETWPKASWNGSKIPATPVGKLAGSRKKRHCTAARCGGSQCAARKKTASGRWA